MQMWTELSKEDYVEGRNNKRQRNYTIIAMAVTDKFRLIIAEGNWTFNLLRQTDNNNNNNNNKQTCIAP